MNSFPLVQTNNREVNQLQQNIKSAVNPLLSNPLNQGLLLQQVVLAIGTNNINHKLNRALIGWFTTRMPGVYAKIYDNQNTNTTPTSTLTLVSDTAITIDLFVF